MKRKLFVAVLSLIIILSFLCIERTYALNSQTTLKPTDDTYVDSSNPTSNYGGQNYLYSMNYGGFKMIWLKFDLSSIPSGATVNVASLQLYTLTVTETVNIDSYSCSNNSWNELTLTYSSMTNYNTSPTDSAVVATSSKWYSWNVADLVRNALNSNSKSVTIVLIQPLPTTSYSKTTFYSKENPVYFGKDYSPKLTISWIANTKNTTPTPTQNSSPSPSVPEFQTWIILLVMIITFPAIIILRRKGKQCCFQFFEKNKS